LRSRLSIAFIVTGSSRSCFDDGVHDLEGHAAQIDILLSGNDLIYLLFPVREQLFGMGHEAVSIRQSQFELPDSSLKISHASFPFNVATASTLPQRVPTPSHVPRFLHFRWL